MEDVELHEDAIQLCVIELESDFLEHCRHNSVTDCKMRTFIAIATFDGLWNTFFTVP